MNVRSNRTTLLTFCMIALAVYHAEAQLAMGKWRTYFAYNSTTKLAQTPNKVFAVSSGALFSVTKADQSIEQYSKITGLSDNSIQTIAFDHTTNQLLIVYSNSNLDLLSADGVDNIPDLFNKQSAIDKTANSVSINGNYAYLSCKFGIVVVNLVKKEIADSYIIGSNGSNLSVLSTAILGADIFALTANGLMKASVSDHNLANYQVWSSVTSVPSGIGTDLQVFANTLWLLADGNVYKSTNGSTWSLTGLSNISRMQVDGTKMYFISDTSSVTYVYDSNLQSTSLTGVAPQMITFDSDSKGYWIVNGDSNGLIQTDASGVRTNSYKPSGPYDNSAWEMKFACDRLFLVPGGDWASQYFHSASVMLFENNEWSYIAGSSIASQTNQPSLPICDFVSVAIDPKDNTHFFASSYGMGLYEFKNNKFSKWYNSQNSAVESIFPGQNNELYYQRLDGLVFDKAGNLWFTNCEVSNSIKYLTSAGIVKPYSFPDVQKKYNVNHLLVDKLNANRKWGNTCRAGSCIFAFDDNGTPDNTADDKQIVYAAFNDQDGNVFTSESYRCLVQDKTNQIWIGTSKGPIIISNPDKAFSSGFTISRIKIPRNDGTEYADYLLGSEQITAIVVDGGNRKWIGTTTSGLYLVSDDGMQTISHFTTDNSPLLSDNIMSLALSESTGELFIGTDQGLISYQTDATQGKTTFDDLYAYPNPVRETYDGLITINGMVTGSIVKITDVEGNLVYETTSNGGTATWNGKRAGGKRVNSGVYVVMAVSPDGSKSGMTKILIIH